MKELTVLLAIEDNKYAEKIEKVLSQKEGIHFERFKNGKDCVDSFYKQPDIIFFSITMSDMSGSVILKKIKRYNPDIAKVFITSNNHADQVSQLLGLEANDYLNKDTDDEDRIHQVVDSSIVLVNNQNEITRLRAEIGKKYKYKKIIRGKSNWLQELYHLLDKAAKTSIPVSISGESGSGRKLVAKTIHYHSSYTNNPFIEVNISAMPENLVESEFFGYERKNITGEKEIRKGKLEEAQRGTLFIKDIDKMNSAMQAKFSDVLRDKEFSRIGSDSKVKFNSRIIVSTDENLLELVNRGQFREDLYYRLLGLPIPIAPLRDRDNDIIHLSRFFLNEFCKENEMDKMNISPKAQEKLLNYPYPGNVRELKAVVELAAVMTDTDTIEEDHINFYSTNTMTNLLLKENTLQEYTRQIIKNFMQKYENNIMLVAKKLDIGKSTIYRMKKNNEI